MSFSFSVNSLSALTPVSFGYNYSTSEPLAAATEIFSNQFTHYKYNAFNSPQDVVLSKKNILILTNPLPLSSIFDSTIETKNIGSIAGTFFLKTSSENIVQYTGDTVYVGNLTYNKLILNIALTEDSNNVEIYTNEGTYLIVDPTYPYTVKTSTKPLPSDQIYRKRFEIDYFDNFITLKTKTIEGDRYLSYGVDGIMRANGLWLNNRVFNSHLFIPTFITTSQLSLGFEANTNEVKYYNDLESFTYRTTLDVENTYSSDTNLLISAATKDILNSNETNINIALLKTNYTSTGAYAPSPEAVAKPTPRVDLLTNEYYLATEDGTTPILVEDSTNVGANSLENFLIDI